MNPSGRNGKTGGATARNSVMREEKSQVRIMQTVRKVGNSWHCSEWDDQLSILGANQRIVIVCRDLSII